MESDQFLEVSHGFDLGGLARRGTVTRSGDSLGSKSSSGSLDSLFTSRGELGDFGSETGDVGLGDRLLLGLESSLDGWLSTLGGDLGSSSRSLVGLEKSVGIKGGSCHP
jgi:hypothetical protein